MAVINQPPISSVDDSTDSGLQIRTEWLTFMNAAYNICLSLTQSGPTSERPTKLLWSGRPFFDETLNRPIWYTAAGWVKSDGSTA